MASRFQVDVVCGVGGGFEGDLTDRSSERVRVVGRVPMRLQFGRHRVYSAAVAGVSWPSGRSLRGSKMVTPQMRRAVQRAMAVTEYDLVHLDMGVMGRTFRRRPACPVLVSAQNVEPEVAKRLGDLSKSKLVRCAARIESSCLLRDETRTLAMADAVITMSHRDASVLRRLHRLSRDTLVPIYPAVSALPHVRRDVPRTPSVLLLGSLASPGRREGAEWFLREVWPVIRSVVPDARVQIVGTAPRAFAKRWHGSDGIAVHGFVHDLDGVMRETRVVVVPLRVGAGIRVKILEMMGACVPVVGTTVATTGLLKSTLESLAIADSARDFAAAALRLLRDDEAWLRAVQAQLREVQERYSTEVAERQFELAIHTAFKGYARRCELGGPGKTR